jgi:hypothetical protein
LLRTFKELIFSHSFRLTISHYGDHMKLASEQAQKLLCDLGIWATDACDKCGQLLGSIRWMRGGERAGVAKDMKKLFLEQLEREAASSRKVVERMPEGQNGWKPHERSMELGYLAALVATVPTWLWLMIERDELDLDKTWDFSGHTLALSRDGQESRCAVETRPRTTKCQISVVRDAGSLPSWISLSSRQRDLC